MRRAATATCRIHVPMTSPSRLSTVIAVSLPGKGWIIARRVEAAATHSDFRWYHSAATPVTARYKQGMVSPKRIGEIPCTQPPLIEV